MELPYSIFLSEPGITPAQARRRLALRARIGVGVLLALSLVIAYASGMTGRSEIAAMSIGGLVGAVELMGRYRQAPLRAVLSFNGLAYILINMGASWCAYDFLGTFQLLKQVTVAKDLTQVLAAGFGALVFMRSSFFKVRLGDTDVGIGPAAILDTLLLIADRGVDRREAVARAQDVSDLGAKIKDPRLVAKMLTKYCLALMQNIDDKTARDVSSATDEIMADPSIPDAIKIDIVALRLLVIVGSDVLEAAVLALGDRLATVSVASITVSSVPPPTFAEMKAEIIEKTPTLKTGDSQTEKNPIGAV